jgi:WD40 repeat protein
MILAGNLAGEAEVRRFRNEAEAAASLDHPNIVPIYEVGEHDGQQYFSMKLIDGPSLAAALPGLRHDPRAAARLLETVARAVDDAHRRGVLHRDLKPANILIDRAGQPHVTDFGLAKKVEGGSALTQSGAIMGTPSYMPPEQASGRRGAVTTASDVYALGAILYEVLTGRPPFRADSAMDTLLQVLEREPERPRTIDPKADRDLETIALKCLEKDPARRYASAGALADDLDRWLAGEPILARPTTPVERAVKWARRRPAIAAMSLAIALLALGGLAGILVQWRRANDARHAADLRAESERNARLDEAAARAESDRQKKKAQDALAESERSLYFNRIALADRYWKASNVARAEKILDECPAPLRGWEWSYLKHLCHPELRRFDADGALFLPDGKRLVTIEGAAGTLTLRDEATGEPIRVFRIAKPPINTVAHSGNGRRLAAAGADKIVKVWDAADGREVASIASPVPHLLIDVALSPDGSTLAAIGGDNNQYQGGLMTDEVTIWDVATGRKTRTIAGAGLSAAFSPDGARLAVCTEEHRTFPDGRRGVSDGALKLIDLGDGRVLWEEAAEGWSEKALTFSPDGKTLASAWGRGGEVRLRDAASGRLLRSLPGHKDAVSCLAFSPDGRRLASGGVDTTILVRDVVGDAPALVFRGHTAEVYGLDFRPDGKVLTSSGGDRTVRLWDATRDQNGRLVPASATDSFGTFVSPDGKTLALLRRHFLSTAFELVDAETGRTLGPTIPVHVGLNHRFSEDRACFSPDGMLVAVSGTTGTVQVVGVANGRRVATLGGHKTGGAVALAFAPDGKRLATGDADTLRIWNLATGKPVATAPAGFHIKALAFSPDGSRIAAVGIGPTVLRPRQGTIWFVPTGKGKVWDVATGRQLFELPGNNERTVDVAFSPDGRRLATASWDQTARLLDAASGKELVSLGGHTSHVQSVAFSPDGRRVATSSNDESIKLWDVATGHEILEFQPKPWATSLAFRRDGRALIAVGFDGRVLVLEGDPIAPGRSP